MESYELLAVLPNNCAYVDLLSNDATVSLPTSQWRDDLESCAGMRVSQRLAKYGDVLQRTMGEISELSARFVVVLVFSFLSLLAPICFWI